MLKQAAFFRFNFALLSIILLLILGSCYYDKYEEIHPLSNFENTCDTAHKATYEQSVKIIINTNCISCHGAGSETGGGIVLDNYSAVKEQVENGSLLGSIKHEAGFQPMPPNTRIQECEINKIQDWLNAGFPN